ncbi:MAG: peptidase T [Prevotellaceae bacterium]|jgi:tripeptide aminopeptidase|nr:peptidase T [Prevotellaceae bacterium]
MNIDKEEIMARFLRYARYDTQSDPASETVPSTRTQLALAEALAAELRAMGAADVLLDENGYLTATIPANTDSEVPVIGLIAHLDTSPDMSGANVCPQITERYGGGDIVLNETKKILLRPAEFPELARYIGQTIITTDGTTLLGADDKAGIAAIMSAAACLLAHGELKHGKIRIAFTPDEEIGRGTDRFDIRRFAADYAYTFDGGELGELEYENFNAAEARLTIRGNNIHTGYAKGRMVNALNVAATIHLALPPDERPETTDARAGFYHLTALHGTEEQATMQYIIRDFDRQAFEQRKETLRLIVRQVNEQYGAATVIVRLRDQYYNMIEQILPHFYIVERAAAAMRRAGVEPVITAARGGTDGARLSFMGLPCPNIFAGGHNPHGKYEFLPVESMQKAAEVAVELCLGEQRQ